MTKNSKSPGSGRGATLKKRSQIRRGSGHKWPISLFFLWVIVEFAPAFLPNSMPDVEYWTWYFYSEDLASIVLAMACYTALSYTSTILKGVSLSAVVLAFWLMVSNALIEILNVPEAIVTAMMVCLVLFSMLVFILRFMLRMRDGTFVRPAPGRIYLLISKPHNLWGMAGLFWSGIGGGFSAYVDGDCYWFSREKSIMVKEHDPDYYKGRSMIDCGPATPEKIDDLNGMVGRKWSVWNNCFSVFGAWRRRWNV